MAALSHLMGPVQAGMALAPSFLFLLFFFKAGRMSHPKVIWPCSSLCIPLCQAKSACNYTHPHCWEEIKVTMYTSTYVRHGGCLLKPPAGGTSCTLKEKLTECLFTLQCEPYKYSIWPLDLHKYPSVYHHSPDSASSGIKEFTELRVTTLGSFHQTCACHLQSGML